MVGVAHLLISCGLSPPSDEALLFRQKYPKPLPPMRGPSEPAPKQALRDASVSVSNQDSEGTRGIYPELVEGLKQSSPERPDSGRWPSRAQRGEGPRLECQMNRKEGCYANPHKTP